MRSSTWHTLGNVYLLVEPAGRLTSEDARALAPGTDGVLEVVEQDANWVEVAIWNVDGSRAELSGNGTRIAATWLARKLDAEKVVVRVGIREVAARVLPDGRIEQDLGDVVVSPTERISGLDVTPVSVGNPHAVVLADPTEITRIGPLLETHARFPERTNVQVARIDGAARVTARVWERGVGETQASGTSAVAIAAATHGTGEVVVVFPGGELTVRLEDGHAWLIGPAAVEFG